MKTATQKFEGALDGPNSFPAAIRAGLALDRQRSYDLGIIRTSLRSQDVLERQKETGINVYQHLPDFKRFGALDDIEHDPAWIRIQRRHLAPKAGRSPVGYVGLVGETVFIAVHDSAIKETLPGSEDDISGLGRNSFTELSLGVSRAASFNNVYAASMDRLWRKDVYGHRLIEGLKVNCPTATLWAGNEQFDLSSAGGLVTAVKGAAASSSAADRMEAAFEKRLNALRNGLWPLASHHLPPPLRRKPVRSRGLLQEVELVDGDVGKIATLLKGFADGKSYVALANEIVALGLVVGASRYTGGQVSPTGVADGRIARILFNERNLNYWETGMWTQRCETSLQTDTIKGHKLKYDDERRQWYAEVVCDQFPFPEGGFGLEPGEWKQIHDRRERERETRMRGAAKRRQNTNRSAFGGVDRWSGTHNGEDAEFILSPEQRTAYLIRVRKPQSRRPRAREGVHVASFTKHLFDRAVGSAILDALEAVTDPIEPLILDDLNRQTAFRNHRIEELEEQVAAALRAIQRWETKFETEDDPEAADRAFERASQNRTALRGLEEELTELRTAAANPVDPATHTIDVDANVTLPVLVANGLLASDKTVPEQVYDGLHKLGIPATLRGEPKDPTSEEPLWTFSATAKMRLTDGGTAEIPLTWSLPSSKNMPASKSRYGRIAADHWAKGKTPDEIGRAIAREPDRVRSVLYRLMNRHGITNPDRRWAAVHSPVPETRAVIAARLTGNPNLASEVPDQWSKHIADTYWGSQADMPWKSPTPTKPLRRSRHVLLELQQAGRDGIDSYPLANRLGQLHTALNQALNRGGYVEMDGRRVRPKPCPHGTCNGLLTHRWPTPETGASGLICIRCWKTEQGIVVPAGYLKHWEYIDGQMIEATPPETGPPPTPDERLIGTHQAAELLDLTYNQIIHLIDHGELAATRGVGARGGKILLREHDVRSVRKEKVESWRKRFDPKPSTDDRIRTGEAMALLGIDNKFRWERLIEASGISVDRPTGHNRTFDRDELLALPEDLVAEYQKGRVRMARVVQETGQTKETIAKLNEAGLLPSTSKIGIGRTYLLDEVHSVIENLALIPGDELIRTAEAARILELTRERFLLVVKRGAAAPILTLPSGTLYYSRAQITALADDIDALLDT